MLRWRRPIAELSVFLKNKRGIVLNVNSIATRTFSLTANTPNRNMSSEGNLVSRILANSVSVANKSAEIVREIMASGELGIVEKTGIMDLQTKADRSVQECILGSLRKNFPGIVAIGEEDEKEMSSDFPADWIVTELDKEALTLAVPEPAASAKMSDICVWVDPLDGTKEYTEGLLDHVTILIGIAVGDRAVAGVINQPYFNYQAKDKANLGRTLYGAVGSGVRGIERTLPPKDQRIVTTTRSHGTGLINDSAEACKPTEVIRVGGAGHKVMLLIEGKAHAYVFPSPGCKRWDTCAPEAILHAMGGKLTDIKGRLYDYNKDVVKQNEWGTLATCEEAVHTEYLNLIPDALKDQVKDYFKNKKR